MSRTRVAVVFGGRSGEHEISCVSAGAILTALDPSVYDIQAIGITRDGRWLEQSADPARLSPAEGRLPEVDDTGESVALGPNPGLLDGVDVVFPVLHGPWGEDGTVQGALELMGVPYVGSGVMASSVTMDKASMKAMFRAASLPVGDYVVITDRDWRQSQEDALARIAGLDQTVFVKPARAGSSMGITKVSSGQMSDIRSAVEFAREHDPKVVVESAITDSREIECGVLTDSHGMPVASACAEIVVHGQHEFYDFEAKYIDSSAELIVPAELAPASLNRIHELACSAFDFLGCEGLARVDFFLTADEVYVNEVNTMPGFTPVSMFPRMWAASGMDYPALVSHLIDDALRRGSGLR